jgi:hypothetical protein
VSAIPSLYLQVEENPNCGPIDGLVFQPRTAARAVERLRCSHRGATGWYEVTGLSSDGSPQPATASLIDDSGDGACYLIVGGDWGLRFREAGSPGWSLDDPRQWGEPYLLIPADDTGLIFCPSTHS